MNSKVICSWFLVVSRVFLCVVLDIYSLFFSVVRGLQALGEKGFLPCPSWSLAFGAVCDPSPHGFSPHQRNGFHPFSWMVLRRGATTLKDSEKMFLV